MLSRTYPIRQLLCLRNYIPQSNTTAHQMVHDHNPQQTSVNEILRI